MSLIKLPRKKAKKGYVWAYVFRHGGKTYKHEGFETQSEAMEAQVKRRSEVKGLPHLGRQRVSLGDLAERYLLECKTVKGLAKNTLRQKEFVLESFIAFLGEDPPAELVTRDQVKEYLKIRAQLTTEKTSGNCAANRDKKEIKSLFNWANNEDILFMRNPCKGIADFPEDVFQAYVPPYGDILKVKMKASADERDFIDCLYYLLGRRKEVQMLRWMDVNLETRWADLFTRKKGGGLKRMPKPINGDTMRIFERRKRKAGKGETYVFPFCVKDLERMMPRLCAEADVPAFGFHALRHHAASSLLADGHSIKDIQFLLGHARASTTEGYLHIRSGNFHRLVDGLQEKTLRSVTLNTFNPDGETLEKSL